MDRGDGRVAVVGQDAVHRKGTDSCDAPEQERRTAIEDWGREESPKGVATKEISREEQPKFWTVKTGVPDRVAGQMNRAQSVENRQLRTVVEPLINLERFVSPDGPRACFQPSANPRDASIGILTGAMFRVESGRRDPRAMFADQAGDIKRVIDVSVGQEDSLDG